MRCKGSAAILAAALYAVAPAGQAITVLLTQSFETGDAVNYTADGTKEPANWAVDDDTVNTTTFSGLTGSQLFGGFNLDSVHTLTFDAVVTGLSSYRIELDLGAAFNGSSGEWWEADDDFIVGYLDEGDTFHTLDAFEADSNGDLSNGSLVLDQELTTFAYTVDASIGEIRLQIQALSSSVNEALAIDNVNITAVPVPAALPLLVSALTLLGFVSRRRS